MDNRIEQLKKYGIQYKNHPEKQRIMKEVNRDLFRDDIVQPGSGRFELLYPERWREREKEREKFEDNQKEKKRKKSSWGSSHCKMVSQKRKLLRSLAKDHPKIFNEEEFE